MNEEYYVLEDGEKTGPFTFNELIERGLDIDTPILMPGTDAWQNASYIPVFIEYFETQGYSFPTEDNLAGFGWRFLAFIIDYMILSLITGLIDVKAGLLKIPSTPGFDPAAFLSSMPQRSLIIIEVSFALTFLVYNTFFEATNFRGSLGKKICGLKVVDADGRKLSVITAFLRNLGAVTAYNIIGMLFLGISYTVGQQKQTWYERLGKTYVIRNGE